MVNILEIHTYLTLKELIHGPNFFFFARKSYNVAPDTYPPKFIAAALIGAEIDGAPPSII